jgi:hypothetical protein
MKKMLLLFIGCLSLTIAAISQNATTWNGYTLDNGNVYDDGFDFILGRTNGSAQARFITSLGLKSWLGIPSGGETLQSVTDRGNSNNNLLQITGDNHAPAAGKGLELYYSTSNDIAVLQSVNRNIGYKPLYIEASSLILNNSSTGNVGIGTTNPLSRLTVAGDIRSTAPSRLYQAANEEFQVGLYSPDNTGTDYLSIYRPGTNGWAIQSNKANTAYTSLQLQPNGGNVGIGTTAPTEKLSVNGNIRSKKIIVSASPWPDYVFDSSYQLAPLQQVEKYIQQNKHLPDVPSATTVEKSGLDLGDSHAILLKKIEELTLYIIEQNKILKEQGERIKKLEAEK